MSDPEPAVPALVDLWRRLSGNERHGPLPGLLLALTVVTGIIDAVSILRLGHVFVANMTGNVVFIGFSVAGAAGFSLSASLTALAAFACGSFAGGRLVGREHARRALLLQVAAGAQGAGLAACAVIAGVAGGQPQGALRYVLLVLLAAGMGGQNAIVRAVAVPDLTTTVLTMTLTGLTSDLHTGRAGRAQWQLRFLAVAAMFAGALVGGLLVVNVDVWVPLAVAAAIVAAVTVTLALTAAGDPPWATSA